MTSTLHVTTALLATEPAADIHTALEQAAERTREARELEVARRIATRRAALALRPTDALIRRAEKNAIDVRAIVIDAIAEIEVRGEMTVEWLSAEVER